MKVAFGVWWRDTAGEVEGQLIVGPQSLQLMPLNALNGGRVPLYEVPFDAMSGLELRSADGSNDRPILVFRLSHGGQIEVESADGNWILGDLLKETLQGLFAGVAVRHRVLVSVKTKPECRERVAELLREGPPFDPFATPITRHDVFAVDDQVLFLFETEDRPEGAGSLADAWRWAESWRDLVVEIRDAKQVFSWTRPASESAWRHAGLGF